MKNIISAILIITILSCSTNNEEINEEVVNCLEIAFLESTVIKENDCLTFSDRPGLEFTLLKLGNYTKTHPNNVPYARISGRLIVENAMHEFDFAQIDEDYQTDGTSFSGRIHTGINNVDYTIFFDHIEFTETATEFIFHNATIRFGYYDPEFD
ncbi:hypothetical protein FJ651_07105 [Paucihalobacter ruber]|uniref:Lipoprotein n=1 Tax=Paucihalobacter ruber TaxID=2567861 RepID=A0A506PJW9_9FLAO|nr:hypothetical protein [Paucihalobacter ruber]TPV33919.1 hypothetical protein FJ651_07105 [Paucihalobacter ruber]